MLQSIAAAQPAQPPLSLPLPGAALSRLRRILVPVDGSSFAEHALTWALEVAHRADAGIDLAFVNVLPPSIVLGDAMIAGEWEQSARAHAESYLDTLCERLLQDTNVSIRPVVLRDTSAASALARHARVSGVGLTVMITHGRRGPARVWLGSVAEAFIRQSSAPVLLLRPDAADSRDHRREHLFRRVVVALDGTRNADAALEEAAMFGGFDGAALELVRVLDPGTGAADIPLPLVGLPAGSLTAARMPALSYLEERAAVLARHGVDVRSTVLEESSPSRAILDHAARREADLLVVGTRGRKGIGRVLLGSVAEEVVRGTTVPVLVVPSAVSRDVR